MISYKTTSLLICIMTPLDYGARNKVQKLETKAKMRKTHILQSVERHFSHMRNVSSNRDALRENYLKNIPRKGNYRIQGSVTLLMMSKSTSLTTPKYRSRRRRGPGRRDLPRLPRYRQEERKGCRMAAVRSSVPRRAQQNLLQQRISLRK